MSIMVYGLYHRAGVYMMQQVFRLLGCQEQTAEDVELVKATINSLHPEHSVYRYINSAHDLKYESGLVDTFLNPQDRAYTVPDVLAFSERNGLAFWDWLDRLPYTPSATIPANHLLFKRLNNLNIVVHWTICEILTQSRGTHRFILCHPDRKNSTQQIQFTSGNNWIEWYVANRHGLDVAEQPTENNPDCKLKRDFHTFTIDRELQALVNEINGQRTIKEVIKLARKHAPSLTDEKARGFFAQMNEWHHLLFSRVPFVNPLARKN